MTGKIVATVFMASIKLNKLSIALQMIKNFEAHLLSDASLVLPTLIEGIKNRNYEGFEIHLLLV